MDRSKQRQCRMNWNMDKFSHTTWAEVSDKTDVLVYMICVICGYCLQATTRKHLHLGGNTLQGERRSIRQ